MKPTPTLPLFVLAAVAGPAGGQPPSWKWTPESIVDAAFVSSATLSPDGTSVVFARSRWRSEMAPLGPAWANLWRVGFDGSGLLRLTTADAEDQRPRFSPDGRRLAFLSRRGPRSRVWVLPMTGGEPEAVTDDKMDLSAFEWSPDGQAMALVAVDAKSEAREKDEKAGRDQVVVDQDLRPRRLWVLDLATGRAEKLASLGEESAWDFAWSPDASALVASVTERNRTDDSYLLKRILVLPRQGERREVRGVVGKVGPLAWSRDGRWIAWLGGVDGSDPAAGSVFVAPAAGGPPKDLTAGREETAVDLAWRPDGRLAVASVVSTRAKLAFVDPATGAWETVLGPGPVVYTAASFSADGRQLALVGSTSAHEPDVYGAVLPVRAAPIRAAAPAPTLRRLVHSNPALADLPRGAQETIRYKAGDGLDLEGVLIRPHGHREGARCPLVVVVHGGPEGQYLDGWLTSHSAPGQALAERGFAVFFPNYRGSTGRGVAFAKADHRDLGGKEFTDVLDGIDALVERGLVDGRRVGMMGGSYGGYFTALAVTRHSARFAAGVEMFGITSWESFLGQTDIPRENAVVHWALSCYEQPALCRERSAIGNLDRARTPTLILQGAEDLRVPRPQSDELHAGLRERGVSVEYVVYPREGHGFRERAHRLDALTRILGWFERHLRPRT